MVMGDVSIRPATPDDAAAICTIYNQGIEDRIATLETEPRTPEERRQWMGARAARHPVVVAVTGGQAVGWGSLNAFNPRPARGQPLAPLLGGAQLGLEGGDAVLDTLVVDRADPRGVVRRRGAYRHVAHEDLSLPPSLPARVP